MAFALHKIPSFLLKNTLWLEKKQTSIISAALIITLANLTSSASGLIRERLLIGSYFGSTDGQQAYEALQLAFQVPDMLFQLIILGALSAAYIPVFTKYRDKNESEAFRITSTVMNALLLLFVIVSGVVFVYAPQITEARTGGMFSAQQIAIAARLTQLMLLAQLFFAISNFLTGILQSYQRFIVPAIAPIMYNLGIVLGVYLFGESLGIYAAGVGVILGAFIHMLIQLPFVLRLGFRYSPILNLRHPGVMEIFRMIPPRVMTVGISELQNLALAFFATSIGNLSFVAMRLALKLMAIPIRLFGVPISQASLPFLSQESDDSKREQFKVLVTQSINQIMFLSMPASALLLILRVPLVRLVFGAENFPWGTTVMTSRVLAIIALSIGLQAVSQLLVRAFYALKDSATPFLVIAGSAATYFLFSWISVFLLKTNITGVAWATLISAVCEMGLFMILLERKVNKLILNKDFLVSQFKIIACAFLMAVFLYLPFKILDELIFDTSRTVELIGLTVTTGTIGSLVYLYFSILFEVKELNFFLSAFAKFGKWRKPLAQSEEVIIDTGSDRNDI
ncbi:MAG TPA: murein biosynthesis integral membrane protein MurJ [Candidatus Woesebacteria bacterium]|nr:murein biosynthesis integral membrane protein MurJ [Candidatus Woesebacteria bacterium]